MRHLWSLLAGVVAAPAGWLLLAVGQSNSRQRVADWEQAGSFQTAQLIWPVVLLAVAGIGLGVLGTLRFSPAGPVAAGILLALPTLFMLLNPLRTLEFFSYGQPRRLFGQDFEPWLPVENGTLLVLGSLLLVAVVSAQRWRRWPVAAAGYAGDESVVAGLQRLTHGDHNAPMSDDEILAAAAAMDEQHGRDHAEQPPLGPGPASAGEPAAGRPTAELPRIKERPPEQAPPDSGSHDTRG